MAVSSPRTTTWQMRHINCIHPPFECRRRGGAGPSKPTADDHFVFPPMTPSPGKKKKKKRRYNNSHSGGSRGYCRKGGRDASGGDVPAGGRRGGGIVGHCHRFRFLLLCYALYRVACSFWESCTKTRACARTTCKLLSYSFVGRYIEK